MLRSRVWQGKKVACPTGIETNQKPGRTRYKDRYGNQVEEACFRGPTAPRRPLTKILREGAQKLIAQAVEAELQTFLELQAHKRTEDGLKAVVRNGYLPERDFQTGIGSMPVKIPKVRDRSGSGIKFNSELVPPYLRRTKSIETLLLWLYLKGIGQRNRLAELQGAHRSWPIKPVPPQSGQLPDRDVDATALARICSEGSDSSALCAAAPRDAVALLYAFCDTEYARTIGLAHLRFELLPQFIERLCKGCL